MLIKFVKVVLVDINPRMVRAWRAAFDGCPEVEVVYGSMLDQAVDAWVTPTNSRGSMDGGLDGVIKGYLGSRIEEQVQREFATRYGGFMPVGFATCVETGWRSPRFLISTPTMQRSSENISRTLNVALACAAAFQTVDMENARSAGSIFSVAVPGLGASTGQVPVRMCAQLMRAVYDLFRNNDYASFAEMGEALRNELAWGDEREQVSSLVM